MTLKVLPMEDADFPDFVRIQIAAFATAGGMARAMTPDPQPPNHVEKTAEKYIKSAHEESDVVFIKVVDTDLDNKLIAGAKWRINEKERTEEQIQVQLPVPGKDEENRPAAQDFMRYLSRVRREYMGTKPFYFLHLLVTDPQHHRRGAGALLLDWGCKRATAAGLPAFLEATRMGKPLYMKLGFEPKHEEVFDLTKYGLEGTDNNTVMIRDP